MSFCNFRETCKNIFHETVTSEVLISCKHGLKKLNLATWNLWDIHQPNESCGLLV